MDSAKERANRIMGAQSTKEYFTGNIHNVSLADKRLKIAGIDPNSLYGKGITEEELQERLATKKRGRKK